MPRYGFTGREHDGESGLIYYRARHYDPAIGQFIQRDPIGFAAGDLNLYAYVGNDPYNFTDPSGLTSSSETAALGASTGGMFAGFISAARNFAWSMLGALALNSDASPDDTPDDTPDNPPIPDTSDPPPPCDPLDPNCVDECYYGEDDYQDALDHFDDELLDVRDGFDWQRVIAQGAKFFDTLTGNTVYTLGSDVVVVDQYGSPRTAYEGNSNATTNNKVAEGRWKPCT